MVQKLGLEKINDEERCINPSVFADFIGKAWLVFCITPHLLFVINQTYLNLFILEELTITPVFVIHFHFTLF